MGMMKKHPLFSEETKIVSFIGGFKQRAKYVVSKVLTSFTIYGFSAVVQDEKQGGENMGIKWSSRE